MTNPELGSKSVALLTEAALDVLVIIKLHRTDDHQAHHVFLNDRL